ncbi:unnamed protein product [Closterium sp. NIES-54]
MSCHDVTHRTHLCVLPRVFDLLEILLFQPSDLQTSLAIRILPFALHITTQYHTTPHCTASRTALPLPSTTETRELHAFIVPPTSASPTIPISPNHIAPHFAALHRTPPRLTLPLSSSTTETRVSFMGSSLSLVSYITVHFHQPALLFASHLTTKHRIVPHFTVCTAPHLALVVHHRDSCQLHGFFVVPRLTHPSPPPTSLATHSSPLHRTSPRCTASHLALVVHPRDSCQLYRFFVVPRLTHPTVHPHQPQLPLPSPPHTTFHRTAPHFTALHRIPPHCTILHRTSPLYTAPHLALVVHH